MSGVNVLVIWIPIIWVWYSRHREKRWNRTYKKSRWIRKKLRCSINDFQSECTFHTVSIYNRRGSKICMHWQKSGVLSFPCKRPFVLMDFPCGFHDSALVSPFFRLHAICWALPSLNPTTSVQKIVSSLKLIICIFACSPILSWQKYGTKY